METCRRVKLKYFWRKMLEDVKKETNTCWTCLRHNKTRIVTGPALSTMITGLFDRVGIDFVFGLPKTKEGYIGIIIMIEYLSKYPYAAPVRSKTAKEAAKNLFDYISLFGAPKTIISDQGKEFVNSIIKELLELAGTEHRITSAYHPQTNGQVENFNKTLANCLRKHAENNPKEWNIWIPYVLMAYRSRVHATTKRTPFELMFGRQMNMLFCVVVGYTVLPNQPLMMQKLPCSPLGPSLALFYLLL